MQPFCRQPDPDTHEPALVGDQRLNPQTHSVGGVRSQVTMVHTQMFRNMHSEVMFLLGVQIGTLLLTNSLPTPAPSACTQFVNIRNYAHVIKGLQIASNTHVQYFNVDNILLIQLLVQDAGGGGMAEATKLPSDSCGTSGVQTTAWNGGVRNARHALCLRIPRPMDEGHVRTSSPVKRHCLKWRRQHTHTQMRADMLLNGAVPSSSPLASRLTKTQRTASGNMLARHARKSITPSENLTSGMQLIRGCPHHCIGI